MSPFRKNFLRNGLKFKTLPVMIKEITTQSRPLFFFGKRKLKYIYIYRKRERGRERGREREWEKDRERILHGRAEIRNFSSSVKKYFTSERSERVKYFFNTNTNEKPVHYTLIVFWCERRDLLCSYSKGDIFTCEDNMLFSHVKISSVLVFI